MYHPSFVVQGLGYWVLQAVQDIHTTLFKKVDLARQLRYPMQKWKKNTDTGKERKVREGTMREQTGFVLGDTIADLHRRVDVGG